MDKAELEKGAFYLAKIVGEGQRELVKIVSILERTCTVEVAATGEIAVAKICDLQPSPKAS